MTRIVVVGGDAGGMSAASQARRRLADAEVIALERGEHISYSACSMPYNIERPDSSIEELMVMTPERFRSERNIEVRVGHEALSLDPRRKLLRVRDHRAGRDYEQPYDRLVIATGASAVRPRLPGMELPGVLVLRSLAEGKAIKSYLSEARPDRAVIMGGGYIGMEMAEALTARGLEVTVLEMAAHVLPDWRPEIADVVRDELARRGVRVETGFAVTGVEERARGSGRELVVHTAGGGSHAADMVLAAVGVRPNVELARSGDVRLGDTGAIAVDDHMRTSRRDVFAAGDCAEAYHLIKREPAYLPLGDTANKQGKVAGANAAGADERFAGVVGSAGFKVFDLEVARTGLSDAEAAELRLAAVSAVSRHQSFAHGYPSPSLITTVLVAELPAGRLLGAQMVGAAVVGKRIDVFATALAAGMSVAQVEQLDLAYAPPISPVYDPILIAASVARKEVAEAARRRR